MATNDRRRALLVAALATGSTYAEAAKAAGSSPSTVYRRMADPEFRMEVMAERDRLAEAVVGRLVALADRALDALGAVLDDKEAPAAARVAAAGRALSEARTWREQAELADRVAALELRARAAERRWTSE